jgi:hypothetical protein
MQTIRLTHFPFCLFQISEAIVLIASILCLTGCYQGAQPDTTPPHVYILKWERAADGSQASQTTVESGGKFNVPGNWLGQTQANIRVYGEAPHGVRKLTVSGSASGKCSTNVNNSGQFFTSPGALTASFPTYVENAPINTTRSFMAFTLDASVIENPSCGKHSYNGAPAGAEYFLDSPATWNITGVAENGSGLQTTGTFQITVQ